jgi:hypothetical protein
MKTLFTILTFCLVLLSLSGAAEAKRHRVKKHRTPVVVIQADVPRVVAQADGGPGRTMLTVLNPARVAVWVYVECPDALTIEPIGIPGHRAAKVNISCPIGLGGRCLIHHWRVQNGHSPESWQP